MLAHQFKNTSIWTFHTNNKHSLQNNCLAMFKYLGLEIIKLGMKYTFAVCLSYIFI